VNGRRNPKLARWQDRLHGVWYAFGYGCNCTRDTRRPIRRPALRFERVEQDEMPNALPIVKPLIFGCARKQARPVITFAGGPDGWMGPGSPLQVSRGQVGMTPGRFIF
jgi:hypothetical protein